jgi:hypothetical protein
MITIAKMIIKIFNNKLKIMKLYLIAKYTILTLLLLLGIAMIAATICGAIKEGASVLLWAVPILAGWAYLTYLVLIDKF